MRANKEGKSFISFGINVVIPAKSGINKTVEISVAKDGDNQAELGNYLVGSRIEVAGILQFHKKGDILYLTCRVSELTPWEKNAGNINQRDTEWLRSADMVIAECTCPSLGVVYELAYAESHNIPVHIFYDKGKSNISAMLNGNSYFNIHPYETEDEIYPLIDTILHKEQRL